jgi:uncharacterized protein (DUF1330 family)
MESAAKAPLKAAGRLSRDGGDGACVERAAAVRKAIEQAHGHTLRTLNGRVQHIEGAAAPKNVAIVEWDSLDDAVAFYKSKAWTDLAPQRDKSQKDHTALRCGGREIGFFSSDPLPMRSGTEQTRPPQWAASCLLFGLTDRQMRLYVRFRHAKSGRNTGRLDTAAPWVGHQSCRLTQRISRPFDASAAIAVA